MNEYDNDEKPLVQAIAQDPLQPTSGTARHRARQPPDEHDDDHRDHLMNMMWMTNLMVKMVIEMVKISMLIMMIGKMIKINGDMMMRNIYYHDGLDMMSTIPGHRSTHALIQPILPAHLFVIKFIFVLMR